MSSEQLAVSSEQLFRQAYGLTIFLDNASIIFQAAWNFYRHCEPDQSQAWQSLKIIFNEWSEVKNNFQVAYQI